jgi:fused signal recognition particle receptor
MTKPNVRESAAPVPGPGIPPQPEPSLPPEPPPLPEPGDPVPDQGGGLEDPRVLSPGPGDPLKETPAVPGGAP